MAAPQGPLDQRISAHLDSQRTERDSRIKECLSRLSPREQMLVREAAVAGFVRGSMHASGLQAPIPPDSVVAHMTIETALQMPNLYPTLTAGATGFG